MDNLKSVFQKLFHTKNKSNNSNSSNSSNTFDNSDDISYHSIDHCSKYHIKHHHKHKNKQPNKNHKYQSIYDQHLDQDIVTYDQNVQADHINYNKYVEKDTCSDDDNVDLIDIQKSDIVYDPAEQKVRIRNKLQALIKLTEIMEDKSPFDPRDSKPKININEWIRNNGRKNDSGDNGNCAVDGDGDDDGEDGGKNDGEEDTLIQYENISVD